MPWQEASTVSLRKEFVALASQEGVSIRALCQSFGISHKTAYKWLGRYRREGPAGLQNQSRRPHHSPRQTPPTTEAAVLALRRAHPAWGARKLHARLRATGHAPVPSPSTITTILRRHGCIDPAERAKHRPWQRFEYAAPNELWQMDFKGHIPLAQGRCHPLTVLDDCSRFALGLEACADERGAGVQTRLTTLFRRYGLPERMVMDNGGPWGGEPASPYTTLTIWLLRLGIAVRHGRPYHPQTQGKDERFHRTLVAEVLRGRTFRDLAQCQEAFDRWRDVYNLERPHEALAFATPASRYQVSPRPFPEALPPIEYGPDDLVRKVQAKGEIHVHGRIYAIGKAFRGLPVALRPTAVDGVLDVYFCYHRIAHLDLREGGP